MKQLIRKCCCCFWFKRRIDSKNPLIEESNDMDSKMIKETIPYLNISNENEIIFEDKYIRDDEKRIISFTKKELKALIDKEFSTNEGYEEVHNKDNMLITMKASGSIFNDKFPVVRMNYTMSRSELPVGYTIDQLVFHISNPETRVRWDKGFKEYNIVEGNIGLGLLYMYMKKPIVLISERDVIEKVVWFKDNRAIYSFSSSVNDDVVPIVPNVIRITDYFSCFLLTFDEESFYFNSLSQIDIKMNLPNFLLKMTLPMKLKEWFKELRLDIHYISQESKQTNEIVLHPNESSKIPNEDKDYVQIQEGDDQKLEK